MSTLDLTLETASPLPCLIPGSSGGHLSFVNLIVGQSVGR